MKIIVASGRGGNAVTPSRDHSAPDVKASRRIPISFGINVIIYGTLPEVDRFVGGFLRGGLGASMPIPPDANPGYKYSETWGACPEGGDVEVLTDTSIVAGQIEDSERPHIRSIKANWVNNNTFTLISHHKEIGALESVALILDIDLKLREQPAVADEVSIL